ncbi:dethiobiotin synthase [Dokdonella sp.]|uniref:dethiobiotin synthase n=1 Tax=Dokdonella sp. TaxID=2291710 RepID=UPI002F40AFEE
MTAPRGLFVTGTDTGVGKTYASVTLLRALRARGLPASGMKPVASGCEVTPQGLRNEDALALIAASEPRPDYATCNPFAFEPPIAPHLAALDVGIEVGLAPIRAAFESLRARAERVVVEGVGGWMAPLSETLTQADLATSLGLDIVLVVGLRLGCINHALLSARAIAADGGRLAGWIANRIDPAMAVAEGNIATLRARIPAPLLGVLDHAAEGRAEQLDVHAL